VGLRLENEVQCPTGDSSNVKIVQSSGFRVQRKTLVIANHCLGEAIPVRPMRLLRLRDCLAMTGVIPGPSRFYDFIFSKIKNRL